VVYQCVGVSYGGSEQGVWKSSNGGITWTHVKDGIRFSGNDAERWGGECIGVRPGNDNEIWAGSRGDGLWRSSDTAGTNWDRIGQATFADAQFTSISLAPGWAFGHLGGCVRILWAGGSLGQRRRRRVLD
jgi:hypothetical protein